MRPLDKGACPTVGTVRKTVTEYGKWRRDLISRIGYYCAYCNMPLSHQLQVEHVVAKVPIPGALAGAMLDWDNMLLACGPCNNAKGNDPSDATLHYLPESHNTHLAFRTMIHPVHSDAAIIDPAQGLTQPQQQKATDTIELLGLADYDARDKIVDLRWMKRKDAIQVVANHYDLFQLAKAHPKFDATIQGKGIALAARQGGFFSLWYDAFINEPEVMRQLTDNSVIPGTAINCFDPTNGYKPQGRNPAAADPI